MKHTQTNIKAKDTDQSQINPCEYAGIDIDKTSLHLFYRGRYRRFSNDKPGNYRMIRFLESQTHGVHVVYESTSYLSQRLCVLLSRSNIAYTCINPARVRNYARSMGLHAKTDKLDAQFPYPAACPAQEPAQGC